MSSYKVAIVGSGPSGFYAAEALFKSKFDISVDMFERLPTPFGLLRGGVAPDHQQMKSVAKAYSRIAENAQFQFYGNIEVGKDISIDELQKRYHAIVLAYGSESDKKLGIPGESLLGSHTATEFVGWYNGHPDYQDREFDLSQERVAIIGQGNVAIDVTRILAKTVAELSSSDISENALQLLSQSKVKEILLIGRRGPAQAAFTELEIKELGELEDADCSVDSNHFVLSDVDQVEIDDNPKVRKNVAVLESYVGTQSTKAKHIKVLFLRSPVELLGDDRVTGIRLEKNQLSGGVGAQKTKGTGEYEDIPVGMVFRSIGYRGLPIEGVPFNTEWGTVPHELGRVLEGETVVKGLYVTGWIKRGPTGVIGTNRGDSKETIASLIEDIDGLNIQIKDSIDILMNERGLRKVTYQDWKRIDSEEVRRGELSGKPREKFTNVSDIISYLNGDK